MELFLIFFGILFALVGSTFSGVQGKARDTERQTDIKAMHSQVEAHYAENGRYPTFGNMNDSTWRQTNMRGLEEEALRDPEGSDAKLSASTAEYTYTYTPKAVDGSDCNNSSKDCTTYELTAKLDDGSTFTKSALN